MNTYECLPQTQASQVIGYGYDKKSPTLLENIDRRIADMKNQIERLELTKIEMQKPGGILNIPIDDLRQAMNY